MKKLFILLMAMTAIYGAKAQDPKVLVAYFSCTGTTETVAKAIAQTTDGDLYRIIPQQPYTPADLDWRNKESRSSREMSDPNSRPELSDKLAKIETYDILFIGFPIWWDKAPMILRTFLESYEFVGKTIIPFATSGSSSIANSEKELQRLYSKNITWKQGKLLNGGTRQAREWAETLKRNKYE